MTVFPSLKNLSKKLKKNQEKIGGLVEFGSALNMNFQSKNWFYSKMNLEPFWDSILQKTENLIPTICHEGKTYCSEEEKAELFAKKLFGTFNECDDVAFNSNLKNLVDDFIASGEYKSRTPNPSPKKFSMDELCNAIRKTNTKKSLDPFGISNFLVKCITEKYRSTIPRLNAFYIFYNFIHYYFVTII